MTSRAQLGEQQFFATVYERQGMPDIVMVWPGKDRKDITHYGALLASERVLGEICRNPSRVFNKRHRIFDFEFIARDPVKRMIAVRIVAKVMPGVRRAEVKQVLQHMLIHSHQMLA